MNLELGEVINMEKVVRRKDKGSFLVRYAKSFKHAVDGIIYSIENEQNVLIMMVATLATLAASFILNVSKVELALVVICIGTVIACEMVNSAIEACVDLTTTKEHMLAKIAKDCASGASLVLSVMSIFVAGIVFVPKIIALF